MNSVDDTLELQLYLFLFARFHLPFAVQMVCSYVSQLMLLQLK